MKTIVPIIATLLFGAPLLHAQSELRPIAIRLTRLASGVQKELAAPLVVVADSQVARLHVGSDDGLALDVSVSPKLDGDRVTLTMKSFAKDEKGRNVPTSFPAITTKLGDPVEVRVDAIGYRIVATLYIPGPKKRPNKLE